MHHPDISMILGIIDDFYIVNPLLKPATIYPRNSFGVNPKLKTGIQIDVELVNGLLSIYIWGENKDDDAVGLCYCQGNNKIIDRGISDNEFNGYTVRNKIREIVKLDLEKPVLQLLEG